MKKNKVTTCGYFTKRLRDNGYIVNIMSMHQQIHVDGQL